MEPSGDTTPSPGDSSAHQVGNGNLAPLLDAADSGDYAEPVIPVDPGAKRRQGFSWLAFSLVGFVIAQVAGYLCTAIAAVSTGNGRGLAHIATLSEPPDWYIGASLVGVWVGFFLGPMIASRVSGSGRMVSDFGIRFRPIDALGVGIGLGAQVVISLAYTPFRHVIHNFTAPSQKLTGAAHGWGFIVIACLTVLGAPLFEELFFRGILFSALVRIISPSGVARPVRRVLGLCTAVAVDGLLFGLAHGEWVQLAGLAAFGAVLAVLFHRTGRLGMSIIAHGSFNLVAVLEIVHTRGGIGL